MVEIVWEGPLSIFNKKTVKAPKDPNRFFTIRYQL
jgi:hypothetical protein